MALAPPDLLSYLRQEIGNRIDSHNFEEGVLCHMEGGYYGAESGEIIANLKSALNEVGNKG